MRWCRPHRTWALDLGRRPLHHSSGWGPGGCHTKMLFHIATRRCYLADAMHNNITRVKLSSFESMDLGKRGTGNTLLLSFKRCESIVILRSHLGKGVFRKHILRDCITDLERRTWGIPQNRNSGISSHLRPVTILHSHRRVRCRCGCTRRRRR